MNVAVSVDAKELIRLTKRFPRASAEALAVFTERVGRKVEREAKVEAPAVTGNLRRQIRFIQSSQMAGVVKSFANYSKYVHGAPFHKNMMKRKETPFLTMAMGNADAFIEAEKRKIITNISRKI